RRHGEHGTAELVLRNLDAGSGLRSHRHWWSHAPSGPRTRLSRRRPGGDGERTERRRPQDGQAPEPSHANQSTAAIHVRLSFPDHVVAHWRERLASRAVPGLDKRNPGTNARRERLKRETRRSPSHADSTRNSCHVL